MIPEHLAQYANAHPRCTVLDLLKDVRKYAQPVGNWDLQQYKDEFKRIHSAVDAAIKMLGG
jgi:hypothetical protein